VVVGQMPMEDVQFVVRHGVQSLENDGNRLKVTRGVQKEASVGVRREVGDASRVDDELRQVLSQE
jgi:hypothetical protein